MRVIAKMGGTTKTHKTMEIRKLKTIKEIETCAQMMASSEPWLTLGRDYEASVKTLSVPTKEVYLGLSDEVK
jgi:hypothetical protein